MLQYKVTFKRTENFYHSVFIDASNKEKAREKAEKLSSDGELGFDYFEESDILDERIIDIEAL